MSTPIGIVGTVATDPRLVTTQTGVTLCTFRLASGERRFDREQQKWVDGETNWFTVAAFRALAEHAHASFRKGQRVIVSGRLRIRRWENGDRSGTSVEVDAEAVGHDLRWGVSRFERRARTEPSDGGGSAAEGAFSGADAPDRRAAVPSGWSESAGAGRTDGGRPEEPRETPLVPAAA
ncbi:single-stranded DNA-binding protein [Leucobacter weissii]|uniref:Single-stranded DNA-binding protein n=1 Tax=Leucobacter weissii TaxID=1983706 RepID=A0A939MJN9_9MICO|nr:single-stranded DNA-binding protein [Leucobacter weissii]MBO1901988.1 single-stranded DNA-binding protein [Leucobacter weissii]